jgi:hypothetical protein
MKLDSLSTVKCLFISMIYILKFTCNYHMPLLELSVRNSTRYLRSSTTLTLIRYQPTICYLVR